MNYLIPANTKKGQLILGIFRPFDLILFGAGASVSLILLAGGNSGNLFWVLLALSPGLICGLLVFPLANYHNVMCALISIYKFYTERRKFVWKGWCFNEQFAREDEAARIAKEAEKSRVRK